MSLEPPPEFRDGRLARAEGIGGDRVPDAGEATAAEASRRRPRRRVSLGAAALALAALCVLADVVAVAAAAAGYWGLGTAIAEAVMVGTLVPFGLGIVAAVFRRGRGFGVAAVVVSVLAHPLVLTGILNFLHG
jgi:hypothetical protein